MENPSQSKAISPPISNAWKVPEKKSCSNHLPCPSCYMENWGPEFQMMADRPGDLGKPKVSPGQKLGKRSLHRRGGREKLTGICRKLGLTC